MVTTVNLAINQSGAQVAALVDNLQAQVTANTNAITANTNAINALGARVATLESSVALLQSQLAILTQRVNILSNQLVWPGLYVGTIVHLKNKDRDCTLAIIYEDQLKRNNPETISVAYVDPDFPDTWVFRHDVREEFALSDVPFNAWHIPEFYYVSPGPVSTMRLVA